MTNLKEETLEIMKRYGYTKDDVLWVGTEEYCIDIDLFWNLSDMEYDNGFGAPEIATDLIVVGNSWWLERHEYDGSEWWEFKTYPKQPQITRTAYTLMGDGGWKKLLGFVDDVEPGKRG